MGCQTSPKIHQSVSKYLCCSINLVEYDVRTRFKADAPKYGFYNIANNNKKIIKGRSFSGKIIILALYCFLHLSLNCLLT
ncbi:hypothetical protein FKM82_007246 [Ascaphus truei]